MSQRCRSSLLDLRFEEFRQNFSVHEDRLLGVKFCPLTRARAFLLKNQKTTVSGKWMEATQYFGSLLPRKVAFGQRSRYISRNLWMRNTHGQRCSFVSVLFKVPGDQQQTKNGSVYIWHSAWNGQSCLLAAASRSRAAHAAGRWLTKEKTQCPPPLQSCVFIYLRVSCFIRVLVNNQLTLRTKIMLPIL